MKIKNEMKVRDVSYGGNGDFVEIGAGAYGFKIGTAAYVSIQTSHPAADDLDRLWIFKRKRFLKVVAKSLNVVIYEGASTAEAVGYYK